MPLTVTSSTSRVSYAGDGATTSFPVTFKFLANADLQVLLRVDATGAETRWTLGTQYSLTGAGVDAGGTLTVSTSPTDYTPASGETLVIYRDPAITQSSDLPLGGAFPSPTVETMADRLTMIAQRISSLVTRSPRQPDGDTANIGALPAAVNRASMYLAFDADGDPIASPAPEGGNVVSAFMATMLDDANGLAARTTLGISSRGYDLIADGGCTGDGTTDDTTAFNAAQVAAVAAGYSFLYLQPGKDFRFASQPDPITISLVGDLGFAGGGNGTLTRMTRDYTPGTATDPFLDIQRNDLILRGFSIVPASGTTGGYAIRANPTEAISAHFGRLEDLYISGSGTFKRCVSMDGSASTTVAGVRDWFLANVYAFGAEDENFYFRDPQNFHGILYSANGGATDKVLGTVTNTSVHVSLTFLLNGASLDIGPYMTNFHIASMAPTNVTISATGMEGVVVAGYLGSNTVTNNSPATVAVLTPRNLGVKTLRPTYVLKQSGAPAEISTAGAGTYTAANLLTGCIVRDCAGAGRTDTLDTAANIVAAVPNAQVGDIIECIVTNASDAAETITIAAGSGGAFTSTQTAASKVIPQNGQKTLRIRLTNVTAASEAYVLVA